MESIDSLETLDEKEKNNAILVTILFGMLAGLWCISWGAFEELLPLTTNKVGYLNAIYTLLEAMLLFIISGKVLNKIKENGKLMLSETIIALIDTISFLISSIMMSWQGILIAYIITSFSSTLGDPIWGSIISEYSSNNRKKYLVVNRTYFIVRSIFYFITWLVCRECVIKGTWTFKYLYMIICILIIITYVIVNKANKKVFNKTI